MENGDGFGEVFLGEVVTSLIAFRPADFLQNTSYFPGRSELARLREEIGIPIPFNEEADYKRAVATTRIALGDDAFDQAWRDGSAMELEEAVRYTLNGRAAGGT